MCVVYHYVANIIMEAKGISVNMKNVQKKKKKL